MTTIVHFSTHEVTKTILDFVYVEWITRYQPRQSNIFIFFLVRYDICKGAKYFLDLIEESTICSASDCIYVFHLRSAVDLCLRGRLKQGILSQITTIPHAEKIQVLLSDDVTLIALFGKYCSFPHRHNITRTGERSAFQDYVVFGGAPINCNIIWINIY